MGLSYGSNFGVRGCAGATRGTLDLRVEGATAPLLGQAQSMGSGRAIAVPCAPGGARLLRKGRNDHEMVVTAQGTGRVALLVQDNEVRQVSGHAPRVWHSSSAAKEQFVLAFVDPNFQWEARGLNGRPWRRFTVQEDGRVSEVALEAATLD